MASEPDILIVDDTESARDTLAALLHSESYRLRFAENGSQALEMARETPPDLILLDVMMPGMNGQEVCRNLREDPKTSEIPIIMVTALDDAQSRLDGIEAGADNFLSKPFNRGELRAQVRTLLRLNRYRRLVYERSRFQWVVEQDDDGFLALSPERRILYANPQARRFLSLPENASGESLPETPFPELALPEYRRRPESLWENWPEPAEAPRYLVRPDCLAANALWLQVDLMPASGREAEPFLVRLRDVTSQVDGRKMTWSLHRQISHKLKTPLNGLTGALDLLVAESEMMEPSERAEFTQMAADSAHRLQREILDIFRYIQTTSAGLCWAERCTVGEIGGLAKEAAASLGIEPPTVAFPADLASVEIPLSRPLFQDLLLELLENAWKFHPEKRPAVGIQMDSTPEGIRTRVTDDGIRLSPLQLGRIWYPYYQGDKDQTGEVPGMGLGLSMVAVVVWEAGGTCRAANRADREGLVVEMVIPTRNCREEE
ncbi:MAG: response regulator [Desulfococcaceae bacterium]